ncbi:MAG: efflux RND transporter permease subunit, partial [Steroidobacteraceae bacterium]
AAAMEGVRLRYRPILMTALGTIAALLPIALQVGIGLESISPLADAAIGGLIVGTALSLFYLPMLYVWVLSRKDAQSAPQSARPSEQPTSASDHSVGK